MWKMVSILLLLSAVPRLTAQTTAPSDPEQARILTMENAWNQALQSKDSPALKMLLAPDLTYVEIDGSFMTRDEYLASVQAPDQSPVRIVNESVRVRVYGNVAVVDGVCREYRMKNGKSYSFRERYTDTWIRRGNDWTCVASQSTKIQ